MRRNLDFSKTLFALSSGTLPSAVAIERLSGPDAFAIASRLFRPFSGRNLERIRGMSFGSLLDNEGFEIDQVLVLGFVGPHSFTGEDVVEFHCHGSIPVIRRLEESLLALGATPADRGEFSYRAHLNGKLSANEIERLADIFVARQSGDLRRIYARRDGSLTVSIETLRAQLIRCLAICDTAVDFVEEYSSVIELVREPLAAAIHGCSSIIQRYSKFREGGATGRIVLAGRPNAGKSSLFNGLLCRYRAIVHPEPGTTRDVIEEDVEIDGRLWKLVDTAGFRVTSSESEQQGMELGEDFLESCSYWILVVDGSCGISDAEDKLLERFAHKPHFVLWNKQDLPGWVSPPELIGGAAVCPISAVRSESYSRLWSFLKESLASHVAEDFGPLPSAVEVSRLHDVVRDLKDIMSRTCGQVPAEYLSEQTRRALQKLESVVGEVGTEDVLDRIFNDFCIGK